MFVPIILVRELRLRKGKGPGDGHMRNQAELPSPCPHSCCVILWPLDPPVYLVFLYHSGGNEMWLRDPSGPRTENSFGEVQGVPTLERAGGFRPQEDT